MKPRLFIEQKITAFANKYKILAPTETGESGGLVALAQQKRLAFKEKVMFYADEKKTTPYYSFRAEKVMDIHGRYLVEDPNGALVGMFKKEFMNSLVNSTWKVMDANGTEQFMVKESNETLALLRRFAGWIPILGDIVEIIVMFLKYHFVFIDVSTNQIVGTYKKTTLFRDHYALEMTDEAYARCDWRVLASMGVALDALQSR